MDDSYGAKLDMQSVVQICNLYIQCHTEAYTSQLAVHLQSRCFAYVNIRIRVELEWKKMKYYIDLEYTHCTLLLIYVNNFIGLIHLV